MGMAVTMIGIQALVDLNHTNLMIVDLYSAQMM